MLRSLRDALRGLGLLLSTQRNARVHALMTVLAAGMGGFLKIDRHGWCWLVFAIVLVWSAEAFNTALERLADRITREQDPLIGQAKDLAAGAVLCAAIGAAVIGLLVLGPPLWCWLWA
jgi:diacylglycerol kinase (ATP)